MNLYNFITRFFSILILNLSDFSLLIIVINKKNKSFNVNYTNKKDSHN